MTAETRTERVSRVAENAQEATKLLSGMAGMAVVTGWKVEADLDDEVLARFTDAFGQEQALSIEELRGYSKGFGTAFRLFTELGWRG